MKPYLNFKSIMLDTTKAVFEAYWWSSKLFPKLMTS